MTQTKKRIRITLYDGRVFSISAHEVAHDRASHYAEKDPDTTYDEALRAALERAEKAEAERNDWRRASRENEIERDRWKQEYQDLCPIATSWEEKAEKRKADLLAAEAEIGRLREALIGIRRQAFSGGSLDVYEYANYAAEFARKALSTPRTPLGAILERGITTLRKIADPRLRDHQEPDAYTQLGCVMQMAADIVEELDKLEETKK